MRCCKFYLFISSSRSTHLCFFCSRIVKQVAGDTGSTAKFVNEQKQIYKNLKAHTKSQDLFTDKLMTTQLAIIRELKKITALLEQQVKQMKEGKPELSEKAKGKRRAVTPSDKDGLDSNSSPDNSDSDEGPDSNLPLGGF